MTVQRPLFDMENIIPELNGDGPRVRVTDPITSHIAADSNNLTASQTYVSDMLWLLGPSADHELIAYCEAEFAANPSQKRWSPSRLRSARHELTGRGLVVEVEGELRVTPFGGPAKVWQVTR